MASQVAKFVGLSNQDRKKVSPPPKLAEGDRVKLRIRRRDGQDRTVVLPPAAASAVETLITRMVEGDRVAVLAENRELSPTEASADLGTSRPLVVLRMDRGDLPFRYAARIAARC